MLGPTTAHELLQRALSGLPATSDGVPVQADVYMLARQAALTRFANNTIHQNVAESNTRVVVRVALGRRLSTATTNDVSAEGLSRAAQTALAFARFRPENPEFAGMPAPQVVPEVHAYDDATAACSPEQRAHAVGEVCARAAAQGLNAAGAFETAVLEEAVVSTEGMQTYQLSTQADFQLVAMSADSSGWAHEAAWHLDALDVPALGDEAIRTAVRGRDPRPLAPGTYPVVLGPDAVQDVVQSLAVPGAGAQAVQEGRSWMPGRQGQLLMSPSVTIWDDGHDLRGWPLAFDGEGVPKQRVDLVAEGVVGNPVYDTLAAGREPGKHSTGHAVPPLDPLGMSWGPLPLNLFMATGTASIDELIAATDRGVYVTRFWYTRVVHPRDVIITGLTRDGAFWIEDGALAYPIQNLRFTQAYVKALAAVDLIGRTTRTGQAWLGATTVPALKLSAFTFTGVAPRS